MERAEGYRVHIEWALGNRDRRGAPISFSGAAEKLNEQHLPAPMGAVGALAENGMISFKNALKAADAEAIRSFLTARANELKRNPPPMPGPRGPGGPPPSAGGPPAPAAHQ
jgi:hypothetical protein